MISRHYEGPALDELETTVEDVCGERDGLAADVKRLRRIEACIEAAERVEQRLKQVRDIFGVEVARPDPDGDGPADINEDIAALRADLQAAQDRIADLEAENERLRKQTDRDAGEALQPLNDYEVFLEDDAVRAAIKEAKQVDRTSPRYIKGVIAAIVDEGGPSPTTMSPSGLISRRPARSRRRCRSWRLARSS